MSDDENGELETTETAEATATTDDDSAPAADAADAQKEATAAPAEEAADAEKAAATPAEPERPRAPDVDITKLIIDDRVKCWCGKVDCKDFTLHKVTELPEGKKPRAVCLQCGAVHFVRLQMPGSSRRATPAVNPWIKAVAGVVPEDATKYTLQGDFTIDQYLLHTKFGLGKVLDRVSDKKISVLFERGTKLLVQQYGL